MFRKKTGFIKDPRKHDRIEGFGFQQLKSSVSGCLDRIDILLSVRVFSDCLFADLLAVVSAHPLLFFFASSSLFTQESEVLSESIKFLRSQVW